MQPDSPNRPLSPLTPKFVTMLAEGYGLGELRKDALAGLTVAVVALPLSMAIAVASGVGPERGLYAAIVGGFLVSALGGSRYQIGGPAGAFIVLVASTVAVHGLQGLLLAVFLSGLMLTLAGVLRLGELIRLIPHAVTVGFTAGIAVVIAASQMKDFFGITLTGPEPSHVAPKLAALISAGATVNGAALAIAALVAGFLFFIKALRPTWPGMLIVIAAATAIAALAGLPVETIGSRFGGIPHTLPIPRLPDFSLADVLAVLPAALAFTLLGSIESLLSAVVADRMTERRHRPNIELVAQGIANLGSALFGGICVTGTIARTATNIRAGAHGPVSGMLHALFLLAFMLLAAPVAAYIPIPALAGALVFVAWNMVERSELPGLLRAWRSAVVLVVTFVATIAEDLTVGIIAGCVLAAAIGLWDRFRARSES